MTAWTASVAKSAIFYVAVFGATFVALQVIYQVRYINLPKKSYSENYDPFFPKSLSALCLATNQS